VTITAERANETSGAQGSLLPKPNFNSVYMLFGVTRSSAAVVAISALDIAGLTKADVRHAVFTRIRRANPGPQVPDDRD